jgi:hypothetical protein
LATGLDSGIWDSTTGEIGILEYVSNGLLIDTTFFLFIDFNTVDMWD